MTDSRITAQIAALDFDRPVAEWTDLERQWFPNLVEWVSRLALTGTTPNGVAYTVGNGPVYDANQPMAYAERGYEWFMAKALALDLTQMPAITNDPSRGADLLLAQARRAGL